MLDPEIGLVRDLRAIEALVFDFATETENSVCKLLLPVKLEQTRRLASVLLFQAIVLPRIGTSLNSNRRCVRRHLGAVSGSAVSTMWEGGIW